MSLTTLAVSLFLASSLVTQSSAGPALPLTITPPSVFFGVRVPVWALRNKSRSSLFVSFRRNWLKMFDVDACTVEAQMVHLEFGLDRSNHLLPKPSVCIDLLTMPDRKKPVAITRGSLPDPAGVFSSPFLHKIHESLHRGTRVVPTFVLTPIMDTTQTDRPKRAITSFDRAHTRLFSLTFETVMRVAQVAVLAPRMIGTPTLQASSRHIWHIPRVPVVGGDC